MRNGIMLVVFGERKMKYPVVLLIVASVGLVGKIANADDAGELEKRTQGRSPTLGGVTFVECYSCVSCPNVVKGTSKKTCPYLLDPSKAKKCVKYSEYYPQSTNGKNSSWVIRGCATERGSCDDIRKAYSNNGPDHVQLEYCTECEGDKCNGGPRSLSDMFLAFFFVVVAPILGKCALS